MKFICLRAALLAGAIAGPVLCQSAELKVRVWEPILKSAVIGADVTLTRADKSVMTGLSGTDGTYTFRGLLSGEHILVTCHRNTYVPDPRPADELDLKQPRTEHDLPLYENSADPAYWSGFADVLRASADHANLAPEARAAYYEKTWDALSADGFSAAARGQAARAILPLVPANSDSRRERMALYARADPGELAKAEAGIKAALESNGRIENLSPSVSNQVKIEIAAQQMQKFSATDQARLLRVLVPQLGIDDSTALAWAAMVNKEPSNVNVASPPKIEMRTTKR